MEGQERLPEVAVGHELPPEPDFGLLHRLREYAAQRRTNKVIMTEFMESLKPAVERGKMVIDLVRLKVRGEVILDFETTPAQIILTEVQQADSTAEDQTAQLLAASDDTNEPLLQNTETSV